MIDKIISGGQTGVDRAALDTATKFNIGCGGWCPAGRKAEDGALPSHYPLTETPSDAYAQRTEWNVRDSDATLILLHGEAIGGTALTIQYANQYHKPCMIIDPNKEPSLTGFATWLKEHSVRILNIAGPRESELSGIYRIASNFLTAWLYDSNNQNKFVR